MSVRLSARCPQCAALVQFSPEEALAPLACNGCGASFLVPSPAPLQVLPQVPAAPPATEAELNERRIIAGLAGMLFLSLAATFVLAYLVLSRNRRGEEVAQAAPTSVVAATAAARPSATAAARTSPQQKAAAVVPQPAPTPPKAPSAVPPTAPSATPRLLPAAEVSRSVPNFKPSLAPTPPPYRGGFGNRNSLAKKSTAKRVTPPSWPDSERLAAGATPPPKTVKAPPSGTTRIPSPTIARIPTPPGAPAASAASAAEAPDPTAPKVLKLPGAVEDSCVGGDGRWFILHLAKLRQLAVFDVQTTKVVKYLPLASDNVRIAAGREKLHVFYVEQASVARYDLATLEKEKTIKLPFSGQVRTAVMGAASSGPILVTYADSHEALDQVRMSFLDGESLKVVDYDRAGRGGRGDESVRDRMHYRAAPDGRSFGRWCTSHSQSLDLFVLTDKEVRFRSEYKTAGQVVPAGNGHLVCGGGIFTDELVPVGKADNPAFRLRVPAQGGLFYISCPGGGGAQHNTGIDAGKPTVVRMIGDDRELAVLKNVELPTGNEAWTGGDFTQDKRVLFHPEAKSIVIIPNSGEPRILVHPFDLQATLDASSVDYLYAVSSAPPAKPGARYSYRILVKSKKGGLKFTLDAGPEGMKVSSTGEVTWTPPTRFDAPEPVVVTIADASGQEMFHNFRVVPAPGGPDPGVPNAVAPAARAEGAERAPATAAVDKPVEAAGSAGVNEGPDPPAVAGDLKLKRSAAVDGQVVKLPGVVDDVAYAGAGRFLLLRMSSTRQIAVLDLVLGKVVKYVPMTEDGALIAGGLRKFYVVSPSANVFQRWDLKTLEKEATTKNPSSIDVKRVLMGCATDGPMFVAGSPAAGSSRGGWGFIDPRTMKTLNMDGAANAGHRLSEIGSDRGREANIRVSSDGRVYAFWNEGVSPSGLNTLVVEKTSLKHYNEHDSYGPLLPGPTGTVFTGRGFFTPELKPIGSGKELGASLPPIPAVDGPWFVSIASPGALEGELTMEGDSPVLKGTIRLPGEERVSLPIPSLKGLISVSVDSFDRRGGGRTLPFYDRIHLASTAEVLAMIPAAADRVVLYRIDIRAGLEAGGQDYLMVVDRPPSTAVRSSRFRYTPDVWSKKKGVKLTLDSGPPGMRISGGAVDWEVPANFADQEASVLVLVSDASGQETFHKFTLTILDAAVPAKK